MKINNIAPQYFINPVQATYNNKKIKTNNPNKHSIKTLI